jgi:endonuclease/exonuclease/phosphatase family metal-dependent hydrolase
LDIVRDVGTLLELFVAVFWSAAGACFVLMPLVSLWLCCPRRLSKVAFPGIAAALAVLAAVTFASVQQLGTALTPNAGFLHASQPLTASPSLLRLASYNLRFSDIDDGPHDGWHPERKHRTLSTLFELDADVVGLQEAAEDQLAFLITDGRNGVHSDLLRADDADAAAGIASARARNRTYAWVGERSNSAEPGRDSAIAYDVNAVDLLESETLWLSETPRRADTKVPGSALFRTMTWALLRRRLQPAAGSARHGGVRSDGSAAADPAVDARTAAGRGDLLLFVNVHLDHIGERARQLQAALLRAFVNDLAARLSAEQVSKCERAAAAASAAAAGEGVDGSAAREAAPATSRCTPHPLPVHLTGDFNSIRGSLSWRVLVAPLRSEGRDAEDAGAGDLSWIDPEDGQMIAVVQRGLASLQRGLKGPAARGNWQLRLWDSLLLQREAQAFMQPSRTEGAAARVAAPLSTSGSAPPAAPVDPISFHAFLGRKTGRWPYLLPLRLMASLLSVALPQPSPVQWRGPVFEAVPQTALERVAAHAAWRLTRWAAGKGAAVGGADGGLGSLQGFTDLHIDWILTGYYGPTPAALADSQQPARRPRRFANPGAAPDASSSAEAAAVSIQCWLPPAAEALRLHVVTTSFAGRYPSDHYPLLLQLAPHCPAT